MSTPIEHPLSGADFIRQFFPTSPYVTHLGMELTNIQPGRAILPLPYADGLVTIGTIIHGGALPSLIDTPAMVAAWSDGEGPAKPRGTTVHLTVAYLTAA